MFKIIHMRTNIEIDDELMAKAQRVSNIKTKKDVVNKALELLVMMESQKSLLSLWGKVEIDEQAYQ